MDIVNMDIVNMLKLQEREERARAEIEYLRDIIALHLESEDIYYWLCHQECPSTNAFDEIDKFIDCLEAAMRKTLEE